MRAGPALVAVLLVAAATSVEATRTLAYARPGTVSLTLLSGNTLPLTLSAGPDGATVSGTNTSTSASLTATAGGVLDATSNNTAMKNNAGASLQARLVFRSISSASSRCLTCKLSIRSGATTTDEITLTNGVAPAAGAAGPWVTIVPGGTASIVADAKATVPTQNALMSYWLEVAPAGATSPTADYVLMSFTFVV
ncbi:MAG: hypothetical protein QOE90_1330 [Thermoplasmata archaeon]|nr:hypothetical protein [Thermoplasmata archaeon]